MERTESNEIAELRTILEVEDNKDYSQLNAIQIMDMVINRTAGKKIEVKNE